MRQLHNHINLVPDLVAKLGALCEMPYEPDAISSACMHNGWKLVPQEDWETEGDPFLRVQITDTGPPLIALWGTEFIAGLPLTVLFQDDVTVEISESAWREFDSLFFAARHLFELQFCPPTRDGTYVSDWTSHQFHFAFFQRRYSTLAILQHDEGDGHLGNAASLDVRIIPIEAERIRLPLETNLIF